MLEHSKCAVIPCQATSERGISNLWKERGREWCRDCSVMLDHTYVGSPDRHESIAPRVGVLEHGTLPFISTSSQPAERKREERQGERGRGSGKRRRGRRGDTVSVQLLSLCLLHGRRVAVVMDNVEVGHGTDALWERQASSG